MYSDDPEQTPNFITKKGPIVHMVERFLSMEEVRGSIPLRSIFFFYFKSLLFHHDYLLLCVLSVVVILCLITHVYI